MTNADLRTEPLEICTAARRFAGMLAAQAMLGRVRRVEARLAVSAAESLFLLDEALSAAWPRSLAAPPRHEVIWAHARTEAAESLELSAFDAEGRLLLRLTYAGGEPRPGEGAS